jgi:hypothetical protein
MENTVTIRIQSDGCGITLLAYIQTENDLVVEHVDVPTDGEVNLLWSRRPVAEGWDA